MDEETARRILLAQAQRDRELRRAYGQATDTPDPEPEHTESMGEPDFIESAPAAVGTEPQELLDAGSLPDEIRKIFSEYLAAQAAVTEETRRLVEHRGGEEHLTEDDQLMLENVRDFILLRYEKLLEL